MEVVTTRAAGDRRRRREGSNGHVVAQLLDSPLPTPRRSCCGPADTLATTRRGSGADASPQRGHVPFAWESSPGVPKSAVGGGGAGGKEREVLPPRPPPGRCGTPWHAHARAYFHGNTTDGSSDDDTFSDAVDRTSSSDRLAALSARLSSVDSVVGSLRLPSFIMDRFLPAANAIATTSADKHPKRSSRRPSASRRSKHEEEEDAAAAAVRARHVMSTPRRSKHKEEDASAAAVRARHVMRTPSRPPAHDQPTPSPPRPSKDAAAQAPLPPHADVDDGGDQMSPRACGLLFFVPWSAKPVLLGFPRSPARCRAPHAGVVAVTASSPPRRSVNLGHVLETERKLSHGDLSYWYDDEKSGSGKEWASPGWGTALLGTSKRYCADARKALSRLARSATDGGGSPRVSRERRSGKSAASALRPTSGKMPPLSPPSESWLSHTRGSNAVNNKV
ncbi:hypothetical protein ACP70R_035537 [Stipagrostis hirtigluma subsp. patula]